LYRKLFESRLAIVLHLEISHPSLGGEAETETLHFALNGARREIDYAPIHAGYLPQERR
jgi:hypothetical protein